MPTNQDLPCGELDWRHKPKVKNKQSHLLYLDTHTHSPLFVAMFRVEINEIGNGTGGTLQSITCSN